MTNQDEISESSDSGDRVDEASDVPAFAPDEPTDGRKIGDWKTRYPDSAARKGITIESVYLAAIFLACPILMFAIEVGWLRSLFYVSPKEWQRVSHWGFAWLGGTLGGTLFSMKWMYHSVARGIWNQDRRLWRLFTPLLSAGVGFSLVALSAGRVIPIFGADVVRTNSGAFGVALLVGYFSDQTISRLADFAEGQIGRQKQILAHSSDKSRGTAAGNSSGE